MNKLSQRLISLLVALVLAFQGVTVMSVSAAGAVYYVSPNGSDTNPGTLAAPFATITKAMSAAQAGDTVYVRAGTYPAFSIAKSGITLAGYSPEVPVISGGSGIRCYNKTSITIKGFEVVGASGNYTGAITLDGCSSSVVESNLVHDNIAATVSGIFVSGSSNRIIRNKVYNNNLSGVRVYGTSLNNEIAFNTIYNHTLSTGNSDGIDLSGSGVTMTNIHDNTLFGNSDDGLDTWDSPGNFITNNVSYGNGGTGDGNGFKLGGTVTGGNNQVKGNVAYSNKACGFTSNGNGNYYEGNTSYNNGTCGFSDVVRLSGVTQTTSYIANLAYNNPTGNFRKNATYTTVFISNSESPVVGATAMPATATALPASSTPVWTATAIPATPVSSSPTPVWTATPLPATVTAQPTQTSAPAQASPTPTAPVINLPSSQGQPTSIPASPTSIPATATQAPTQVPPTATWTVTLPPPTATAMPTFTATVPPPTATKVPTSTPVPPTVTPIPPTLTSTPVVVLNGETVIDDRDSRLVFSPEWQDASKRQAYQGTLKQTSKVGAQVTLSFTGQGFSVLYRSGKSYRTVDVYVDDVLVGTLNQQSGSGAYQQRWDYAGPLAPGNHTLKLVYASGGGDDARVSVDAVIIR